MSHGFCDCVDANYIIEELGKYMPSPEEKIRLDVKQEYVEGVTDIYKHYVSKNLLRLYETKNFDKIRPILILCLKFLLMDKKEFVLHWSIETFVEKYLGVKNFGLITLILQYLENTHVKDIFPDYEEVSQWYFKHGHKDTFLSHGSSIYYGWLNVSNLEWVKKITEEIDENEIKRIMLE